MKAYLVMNVMHLHWSHRNECDLRTDIGTWIASSLCYRDRVQMRGAQTVTGFPYQTREQTFQGQPNEIQWNLELRTQSVPGDGSTFKLFDFRVKFPHKK
jgi:hypothetical protein